MGKFLCKGEDEEPRLHLITAGDFTQLSLFFQKFILQTRQLVPGCNKQEDLYAQENRISRGRTISAEQITGFHLWRIFEIVTLTENMRHAKDPDS